MRRMFFVFSLGFLIFLVACTRQNEIPSQAMPDRATQTSTPQPSYTASIASSSPAQLTPTPTTFAPSATPTSATASPPGEAQAQPEPPMVATPTPSITDEASPTNTQEIVTTESSPSPGETGCKDAAVFVNDITIPDGTSVRQGDGFVKTWRVQNAGTCSWGPSYSLVFASGEVMDAALTNPLPDTSPGSMVDLSIEFTAPPRGGTYRSYWVFQNPAGERFGVTMGGPGWMWVEVNVSFVLPTADASITPTSPASTGCAAQRDTSVEAQILAAVNQARQENGLGPLTLQEQLSAAALQHSRDMACNGFVNHSGSDGSLWYDRVAAQGYANSASARENIYVGDPQFDGGAQGAFNWWWNSQIHKDNILFEHVSDIGIAYVFNPDSEYKGYYTVVFARP